jgi:antitoxin MazE
MTTDISRWGNSLAVRIPRALAERVRLSEGDTVTLEAGENGTLIIRPSSPRYTLDQLVAGITPRNRHEAVDWGDASGDESW